LQNENQNQKRNSSFINAIKDFSGAEDIVRWPKPKRTVSSYGTVAFWCAQTAMLCDFVTFFMATI